MKNYKDNAIITKGSGSKNLVFIHYFGGKALSWQWMTDFLEEDYKCILINLPGFGSTKPLEEKNIKNFAQFIADEIEKLGLKDYALCGHSMGAKLVAYATTLLINKPKKLILVAPSPPTVEKMPEEEKKRMLKHPDQEEAVNTVKNASVQELNQERYNMAVSSQLEIDEATWRWWLEEGMSNDVSNIIQECDIPTTIICSEDDPVIPMEWIEKEVKPYFKNREVITWSGVGHLIPLETPEKLAKTIKKLF